MANTKDKCSSDKKSAQYDDKIIMSQRGDVEQHFLIPIIQEDRRLMILFFLIKIGGYKANNNVLYSALERVGHCVSWHTLHEELAWLEHQGLATLCDVDSGMQVIKMTRRGRM